MPRGQYKNNIYMACPICKRWRYVRKYQTTLPTFTGLCQKCSRKEGEGGHKEIPHEGYILVYEPSHPRASNRGYVKRAVLVLEQVLGRYLRHEENIHHINGQKDDDRPINLQILSNAEHCRLHARSRDPKEL